eukprot:TRINITY_DN60218_c0_g1_i2.p1 TRINITY_DN60218_c0_g1~~TRINITY_DN60218_c0_g1_i2.p1  ORF type:complete len:238 (+),score=44.54 TRINITY_DN60218_c0_g1_i2:67-780(+)
MHGECFFFNDTATTEIYTRSIVGSVRCVQETGINAEYMGKLTMLIWTMLVCGVFAILNITNENFEELVLNSESTWFVRFHTNRDPKSLKLDIIWPQLEEIFLNKDLKFGQIDIDEESELRYRFEVKELPNILLLRDKQTFIFTKDETIQNLIDFVKKNFSIAEFRPVVPLMTSFQKIIFNIKLKIESLIGCLDYLGMNYIPYEMKLIMVIFVFFIFCLLYTSPSPRDLSTSRMPSSA